MNGHQSPAEKFKRGCECMYQLYKICILYNICIGDTYKNRKDLDKERQGATSKTRIAPP